MPRSDILALTLAGDVHTFAVERALELKGERLHLWYTGDFPSQGTESLEYNMAQRSLMVSGAQLLDGDYEPSVVWNRRVACDRRHEVLALEDCEFAEIECHKFREGLLRSIAHSAFWINTRAAAVHAENKLTQNAAARRLDLRLPHTLYTNDPAAVRDFIRAQGGRVVYKPFLGAGWVEEGTKWGCYTSIVTEAELPQDKFVQEVPGIYQELVPKAYELRVTVMGNLSFCSRISSQDTAKGRVDWRLAYDEIEIEAMETPEEVHSFCQQMMGELGLRFGCFDFIVTPRGEPVFLEVNQQGQFLFIELYTGQPLLDAFTTFLMAGRCDFDWDSRNVRCRYEDIRPIAEERARQSLKQHLGARSPRERQPALKETAFHAS